MFDFIPEQPIGVAVTTVLGIQLTRYALVAGGVFTWVWLIRGPRNAPLKIDPKPLDWADVHREVRWSVLSLVLFSIPTLAVLLLTRAGHTHLHHDLATHGGWPAFFAGLSALLLFHDLYFYAIHRAMHHPWLYRHFHEVHHRSVSPTPWAAFSFHPLEALLESGVVSLAVLLFPLHVGALFAFQGLSILMNVYGHLGYDLTPRRWATNPVLRHLNGPRLHQWHHKHYGGNYGLYTTVWDRLFGTLR